jgi:hypothetical protein
VIKVVDELQKTSFETIHHDVPSGGFRITIDCPFDVVCKVFFCACIAASGRNHLTGNDIRIDNQRLRAMPDIFEFTS